MNIHVTGALMLLAALWGGSFIFIRIAAPYFGPIPLMAGRTILAAVFLALILAALRKPVNLRRFAAPLLILAITNAAIPFSLIAWAELTITASHAALLNATTPAFAAIAGHLWKDEPLTASRSFGLALGVIAVGVLTRWGPQPLTPAVIAGTAAMLLAAACYGFSAAFIRRRLTGAPVATLALGQQVFAGLVLALPGMYFAPAAALPLHAITALLALALLSTSLAYLLYFHLIRNAGPVVANTVTFLIPLFGVLFGIAFLGETITRGTLAGVAMMLCSLFLVVRVKTVSRVPVRVAR